MSLASTLPEALPGAFALPPLPAATPAPVAAAAPAVPAPASGADTDSRLQQLEAFDVQVTNAIESLVTAVLEVKTGVRDDLAPVLAKLKDLEQQIALDRACRDFADVSRMHPKEPTVVFVGTTFFGDNVKYAWAAFRQRAQTLGIECWWLPFDAAQQQLVESLGGHCFPVTPADWTPEHLHTALSAACVVLTDHFLNPNPYASSLMAGARHVQLWHGLSIKEIGLRNLPGGRAFGPHLARVLATCGRFASFVGTTQGNEADWRRWLAFERYEPIGYPRNDVLHRQPAGADLANVDLAAYERANTTRAAGRRVFVYAPTFRDAERGRWILNAGLEQVARAVAERGDCLLVNLHPVEAPMAPELAKALPTVGFVAPRTDIYPLLALSDALVTDYSSLIFDYLQVDRPILLFRPDHGRYVQHSRKLFDQRLATLPGPVSEDAAALIRDLERVGKKDAHAAARRALSKDTFDHHDGQAAERVIALIAAEVERAVKA
jgi:CDP-glycerol glycerophosphotransferase